MEYVDSAENETFALLKDLGLNPACETSARAQSGGEKKGESYIICLKLSSTQKVSSRCEKEEKNDILISQSR